MIMGKKINKRTKRGKDSAAGYCRRTYKFRVYPQGEAESIAGRWLFKCWLLYKLAWWQRQYYYKPFYIKFRVFPPISLSNYDQYKLLIGKKTRSAKLDKYEFDEVPARVRQDVLQRLEMAYQHFFRRLREIKEGLRDPKENPGFPKEPKLYQYESMTFDLNRGKPRGWKIEGDRLRINRVGEWRIRIHRPWEGRIKTITLIREVRQWYVCLSCEGVPCKLDRLPSTGRSVGIYLERPWFGVDSEGKKLSEPRFFRDRAEGMAERQRRYERRKKGSRRRKKAAQLHAQYRKTEKRKRKDYIENLSLEYLRNYDLIILNKLHIARDVENQGRRTKTSREIHKEILDNGWGQFVRRLQSKALQYGKRVVEVEMDKPMRDFVKNAQKLLACVKPSDSKPLSDKGKDRELRPPIEGTG